jgi:hypothetical protein
MGVFRYIVIVRRPTNSKREMMNNPHLNYLIATDRVKEWELAADRYRLSRQVANSDSRPRSLGITVLSRFRRRDTRPASIKDPLTAGRAELSSLDGMSPTCSS